MSDLNELVETFKRAVARPGTFATLYPETTDADLAGSLMDAFAEAQLDGFFASGYELDLDAAEVTPDLTLAEGRLVSIYAAVRFVESELISRKSRTQYEANGAKYDVEYSASLMTQLLKSLQDRKAQIVTTLISTGASSAFYMADQYFARAMESSYGYMIGSVYTDEWGR